MAGQELWSVRGLESQPEKGGGGKMGTPCAAASAKIASVTISLFFFICISSLPTNRL
jgi:hypothetical protein